MLRAESSMADIDLDKPGKRRPPGHWKRRLSCERCGNQKDARYSDGVQLRDWCPSCDPHYACGPCDDTHRAETTETAHRSAATAIR